MILSVKALWRNQVSCRVYGHISFYYLANPEVPFSLNRNMALKLNEMNYSVDFMVIDFVIASLYKKKLFFFFFNFRFSRKEKKYDIIWVQNQCSQSSF